MAMKKEKQEKLPKEVTSAAWAIAMAAIAPMLDTTMVNIGINKLGLDFHTSLEIIQWVITGYVLALAVAVPVSGWLMDKFNGKKVLLNAELGFILSSVLAGISWNIESLIAFRLLQGVSAGIIIPLMTTLLMKVAGPDMLGRLMAVIGTPIILGPLLGPVIGGFIIQLTSWRWIFFINIPFGLIALYLVSKRLDDFEPFNSDSKIDWVGIILLAIMSSSMIFGITRAAHFASFHNHQTYWYVGIGLVTTIAYAIYNVKRNNKTVMPLNLFKHRSFSAAIIGMFLAGLATNGPMLLLPLFFQNIRGFTLIEASLAMIPQGVGMLIARPIIGKLIDRLGAKLVVIVSLTVSLVGSIPFIFIDEKTNFVLIAIVLVIRGIGVGGITMPLMSDVYTGLQQEQIPQASIGSRIIQNVGSSFGSAALATVVATVVSGLKPTIPTILHGYQVGFLISVIVIGVMFIPALFLTNKRKATNN
ncbi:multidrug efflux MFS transporter [Neobacillus sp. MM2021_6]|uniref:DHA2 family efflux MFS transporter permease subunit n=1 Tax=Bacillaceae TaxID=186817 RepID=UPI00140E7283|nr:multidrug efflux MFS transporter [Neobacillus sp. MM2021_6]NHC19755.1 multidrug efflux MFS transporter [Bacillus sp. MM2020_4]